MNLLLDEVARATLRLAEAGVASPRADAEELAATTEDDRPAEVSRDDEPSETPARRDTAEEDSTETAATSPADNAAQADKAA